MEFKIFETNYNNKVFRIEEDYPEVGAYLYIYEDGICIKDFLQNSIKDCMEIALEKYQITFDKWNKIK